MLVELSIVEQRYQAVLAVIRDGANRSGRTAVRRLAPGRSSVVAVVRGPGPGGVSRSVRVIHPSAPVDGPRRRGLGLESAGLSVLGTDEAPGGARSLCSFRDQDRAHFVIANTQ